MFGTVFLGASILLAALVFVGSALLAAPAVLLVAGDRTPDPDAVSLMRSGAAVVLSVFAPRIATPTVYVMPAWIALVSIVLLVWRPPHAFELEAAPGSRTL